MADELYPAAIKETVRSIDFIVNAVPAAERRHVCIQASHVELKVRAALILLVQIAKWMDESGHTDPYLRRMIDCVTNNTALTEAFRHFPGK